MPISPVRFGMVHGRFQPFHNGHLRYTLEALARSEHLVIGITNPDPSETQVEAADSERHKPESNPFTFFERQWMIRAALAEEDVDLSRVSIVPFPIHNPERWEHYCPKETVQFIRIFSDWSKQKAERFQAAGWQVEILDPGVKKQDSGSTVRWCLCEGQGWEYLVPRGVSVVLKEIGAQERLARLFQ